MNKFSIDGLVHLAVDYSEMNADIGDVQAYVENLVQQTRMEWMEEYSELEEQTNLLREALNRQTERVISLEKDLILCHQMLGSD